MGDRDWTHAVPGCTSQSNEDLIIAEIFSRIGEGGKRFVEFGSGDGRQNNTRALLLRGWSGIWYEPHRRRYDSAKNRWLRYPYDIHIIRRVITPENVNSHVVDPIDFLSIDVDGGDSLIWQALRARPRVVCIELTGKIPECRMASDTLKAAPKDVSVEDMTKIGRAKGYTFVCTSLSRINAFFVRDDECLRLHW